MLGVSKDGLIRHFFHRPSKAYTTGNRKRRKVHTGTDGGETRWHKTGKTRPVFVSGRVKGYKKILVLYTNYGKQRKPEKTNWVMHQYHLGISGVQSVLPNPAKAMWQFCNERLNEGAKLE